MTKLFHASWIWTLLGLAGGLFYREYTKAHDFTDRTQLAIVHTHALVLGMVFFLLALAISAVLPLARQKAFVPFFWTYNAGLVITVAMQTVHGMLQVTGHLTVSAAIPGIAGIGHLLLTVGLVAFFLALRGALKESQTSRVDEVERVA